MSNSSTRSSANSTSSGFDFSPAAGVRAVQAAAEQALALHGHLATWQQAQLVAGRESFTAGFGLVEAGLRAQSEFYANCGRSFVKAVAPSAAEA